MSLRGQRSQFLVFQFRIWQMVFGVPAAHKTHQYLPSCGKGCNIYSEPHCSAYIVVLKLDLWQEEWLRRSTHRSNLYVCQTWTLPLLWNGWIPFCLDSCKNKLYGMNGTVCVLKCVCIPVPVCLRMCAFWPQMVRVCSGSDRNNNHDSIRGWIYQKKLRLRELDKGCHLETQLVMEWSKTYENNIEVHSWLRVNLRVWPNDGASLSTGLAERNWVWNSRPRSITAPV